MIRSFSHKGLKRLFEDADARGVQREHTDKLEDILAVLNHARRPQDMGLPAFKLHPLKGKWAGFWAVTVRANWRVIFRFEQGDAYDVDLIDYH